MKLKVATAECVSEPLVPVIVRMEELATVEIQDRLAVPEPVTEPGVIGLQTSPGGVGLFDRDTIPAKPFCAVTVIVDIAEEPTKFAGEVAVIEKSTKLNAAVAVWVSEPLVPFIVTVNWPAVVELQDNVADPEPVTLPGKIVLQDRLAGTVSVKATLLENEFKATTVTVEDAVEPTGRADGELAEIEKSRTWKVIVPVE